MTFDPRLTRPMEIAMADIARIGGTVERKPGGYWVRPGVAWSSSTGWGLSIPTTTVQALVRRGKLAYTEHQEGRRGKFPIRAAIPPKVTP